MPILHLRAFVFLLAASAVAVAQPVISGTVQDTAIVNGPYTSSALSVSGGASPYQWDISGGAFPPGLVISPSTGVITGTPTTSGNFNFQVRVMENGGLTGTSQQSIQVATA